MLLCHNYTVLIFNQVPLPQLHSTPWPFTSLFFGRSLQLCKALSYTSEKYYNQTNV